MPDHEARHSPSSRALKAVLEQMLPLLEAHKTHRTETYRWARGGSMPTAENAAKIERVAEKIGAYIPANGWTPDGKGEKGPVPEAPSAAEGAA